LPWVTVAEANAATVAEASAAVLPDAAAFAVADESTLPNATGFSVAAEITTFANAEALLLAAWFTAAPAAAVALALLLAVLRRVAAAFSGPAARMAVRVGMSASTVTKAAQGYSRKDSSKHTRFIKTWGQGNAIHVPEVFSAAALQG
jgi:hypothetical protein